MKIAVYSPNWVGDATLALPFIHQLKEQYPHSKIVIVCKDWVESVFINNPNIDDIISLSKKDVRGIVNTIRTGMSLREQEFDCFYTLTDSFRSALIMWLSNTGIRVGYKSQARSFLISKPISKPPTRQIIRSRRFIANRRIHLLNTPQETPIPRYYFIYAHRQRPTPSRPNFTAPVLKVKYPLR